MIYVGIDPGRSGGMALIEAGKASVTPMPETVRDIWDWFCLVRLSVRARQKHITSPHPITMSPYVFAVVEKVGGYIRPSSDGLTGGGQPGSHAFTFGKSYGMLLMALTATGIPYEEVTPQNWQRELGLAPRSKGESKNSHKNRLKGKAQQLFPDTKVTLKTADALLLAECCRRRRRS